MINDKTTFYASVALLDNKILFWKVSPNAKNHITDWYKDCFYSGMNMSKLESNPNVKVKVTSFSEEEYPNWEIFEKLAPNWFKQWEIHEDFKGSKPYLESE